MTTEAATTTPTTQDTTAVVAGGATGSTTPGNAGTTAVTPATPPGTADAKATPKADEGKGSLLTGSKEDPKPDGAKAPAAEEISVKLPEGRQADEVLLKDFTTLAKEVGLKSEGAQKLLDLYIKNQDAWVSTQQQQWQKTQEDWKATAKADKEYGGAKFEESLKVANRAIDVFCSPELKKEIQQSGWANHPEFVRLFVKVGKSIAEDSVKGSSGGTAGSSKDPFTSIYNHPTSPQE